MIKFFRKIRQRLLAEGKTTLYLKYAVGEIVLVVIGILIALQVNDWNEQRKLGKTNELLKQKLIGELELNVERLFVLDTFLFRNEKQTGLKYLIMNADTAIQFVQDGLDTAEIKWLLHSNYFVASSFNLHSSVFEEMKNTGRLYSLGSDSLIHSIDKYYRRIEREEYYNNQRNDMAIKGWMECKYGFQNFRIDHSFLEHEAIKKHNWLFDPGSTNFADLKIALYKGRGAMQANRERLLEVIEDSGQLISEIKNEMKQARR